MFISRFTPRDVIHFARESAMEPTSQPIKPCWPHGRRDAAQIETEAGGTFFETGFQRKCGHGMTQVLLGREIRSLSQFSNRW
jgi:hypothetical protein